jgi:hypothetical protein
MNPANRRRAARSLPGSPLNIARRRAWALQKETREGATTRVEKPEDALERYRADYEVHSAAANEASSKIASLSTSIATAKKAMAHLSPAIQLAHERVEKSITEMQSLARASTSGYYPPGWLEARPAFQIAAKEEANAAYKVLKELENSSAAADAPILIQQQALGDAKITEAKEREAMRVASEGIAVFEELRRQEDLANSGRLEQITRRLASANIKASHNAARQERVDILADKLSLSKEIADAVLKHLDGHTQSRLARRENNRSLDALKTIRNYAIKKGVTFKDAENILRREIENSRIMGGRSRTKRSSLRKKRLIYSQTKKRFRSKK